MKLLFLDIDGVLNTHEWDKEVGCGQIHQDKMQRLNKILKKTNAKVVVSSAWRYLVHRKEMNLTGLDWLLRSHGMLKDRLHGITREDSARINKDYNGDPSTWVAPNERGLQIHEYLDAHCGRFTTFCVVDDLDLGISAHKLPFVQTDGAVGLQDGHVAQIIRILNGNS